MVEIFRMQEGSVTIVRVVGELDASSSIALDQELAALMQAQNQSILVDCTNLQYISSAGLGVFMSYIQEMEQNNIQLVLFGLSPKVKNVFEILGLDQLLPITETKELALQQINEA
jgi:anti-sigma B factor antagonist